VQTSSHVQLVGYPLPNALDPLLKCFDKLFHSQLIVSRYQLDLTFNFLYYSDYLILRLADLMLQCIIEQRRKLTAQHCLMPFSVAAFMLAISKAVNTFQLLTHEAIVGEGLVMM
jgi:hypothetical protein